MTTATPTRADRLVTVFAALADPTRLAIIELLRTQDHCVCHLVERLDLKQSVISHHLATLRRADLVSVHPYPDDRRWTYYRLNRGPLDAALERLRGMVDIPDETPAPLLCGAAPPVAAAGTARPGGAFPDGEDGLR